MDRWIKSDLQCTYIAVFFVGWFMAVTAVNAESSRTAVLMSPTMQQSSLTCRLHLRYFIWDSSKQTLAHRSQNGGTTVKAPFNL